MAAERDAHGATGMAVLRTGVAACALGAFLAGPQVGAALADNGGNDDSVAASAAADSPPRTARAAGSRVNGRAKAGSASTGTTTKPRPAATSARQGTAGLTDDVTQAAIPRPARTPATPTRTITIQTRSAAPTALQPPGAATSTPSASTPSAPITPPAPARVPAAAAKLQDINTKTVKLFDTLANLLARVPNQNLSDFFAGGLLMLRRSFFDQVPTASPVQESTTSSGQIQGTLGAIDPEDDPLTFIVVSDPQYGTVQIGIDGHYTYTPGTGFAGSDSFAVQVTDSDGGRNLLNPLNRRATEITVEVGARAATNPFSAGNLNDASLLLKDTAAQITVERKFGRLIGTIALAIPDDTALLWLDEHGRTGTITAAEVATRWDGIQNAGDVMLGLDYTLDDGTEATVILRDVEATSTEPSNYVFSGTLAPDAHDGTGVNSFWDVIGNDFKNSYENFRLKNGIEDLGFRTLTQQVTQAALYLDTFNVHDYEQALIGADLGVPLTDGSTPKPLAATDKTGAFSSALSQEVLKAAVAFGQGGGQALAAGDPVFTQTTFQPVCKATSSCGDGSIYTLNVSNAPSSLVSKSFAFAGADQSIDLSFDFGETSYGYVYVPGGVWKKLDPAEYSFGAILAITTGPSVNLNLGSGGNSEMAIASTTLTGPTWFAQTPYGSFQAKPSVSAGLNARLELPDGFVDDKLKGKAYVTGGLVVTYNSSTGWNSGWNYYTDFDVKDFTDFADLTSVSITPTITPKITGSWGFFTPSTTPIIGQWSVFKVALGYDNPVDLNLTLSQSNPASLTLGSAGNLDFSAGFIPDITSWLSYKKSFPLYSVRTGNLLAA